MNDSRIIVALDYSTGADALAACERLDPALCRVKVGKELFTAEGPVLLESIMSRGFGIFLDLKYHDIPNTVAGACRVAASLGVWMVNVHALGGRAMMEAAVGAVANASRRPLVTAVTVLTSMGASDLLEVGLSGEPSDNVSRLALLARSAGLDGVVCSGEEAAMLRAACGPGFMLVTPGIRPADAGADDQKRIMTPARAIAAGSTYLVIGRPITKAADPAAALRAITNDIEAESRK
jgi:orotidine-5'-phosphate decarboxylase